MNRTLKNPIMNAKEWLLLVILSMFWGSSFFLIKVALEELQPLTIVLGRVGLAAIALTIFVYLSGQRMPSCPRIWGAFFVMGALNNLIPFSLIVWGETQIDSSLAAIVNATTPLFTVVLAHLLNTKERLTSNRLVGVLFGLCGVIVLVGSEVLQGLQLHGFGQAVLGAAFSYSCAGIYGHRFRELSSAVAAAGMLISTTIMTLPLVMLLEQPLSLKPNIASWGAMFGLGIFSTAISFLIYFYILAVAGATNVHLVTFLIPVSALLLGVFVLNERLNWHTFAGMALIFVGLVAIDGRLFSRFRKWG